MAKKVVIIGAGFGGLGAACLLGYKGYDVTVVEKNKQIGGRAGMFSAHGFRFDTGPSWYLMPDVFEKFFSSVGEKTDSYFKLLKLSPSYRVFFKNESTTVDMTSNIKKDAATFESMERGAGAQLKKYLKQSEYVYNTAVDTFLYKNYDSILDFISPKLLKEAMHMTLFKNMNTYVSGYFKDTRLQKIMQYPLVFLGASPYNAPALYNLMSHIDFNQGVFYPSGGIYSVSKALEKIAKKNNVKIDLGNDVNKIVIKKNGAKGVITDKSFYPADIVISNADIEYTESSLLGKNYRDHSRKYWDTRTLAPSALLIYLGISKKYPSLQHHNLLFSQDWKKNFDEIFNKTMWPSDPSLYVCAPSKTDPSVAPKNQENLFVLVPTAAGLNYTEAELENFSNKILQSIEHEMNLKDLRRNIVYKKLFCVKDFSTRFNSFKGTGLGLAHTLKQTAVFRPKNQSKKVRNLFYVGANVHPGIGLPVTLISAQLAYERIERL